MKFANNSTKKSLLRSVYERARNSSTARRILRGSLWSLLGSGISRIAMLIGMVLVARILGKASFGEFGIVQATLGVVGLIAGINLGSTATRFVAHYAETDPDRAGRIIALVVSVSLGTVSLAALILIGGSGSIARHVLAEPQLQNALVFGALLMAATAFRGIQGGVLSGLERFDLVAKLNVLDAVLSVITMVLLARFMGVEGAILGLTLGASATWLVGRLLLSGALRSKGIDVKYRGCWSDRNILLRYSLPSLLAGMVATPVLWYCMTLLARTKGYEELGLYNAAYQWHGPMVFIPMILMSVSIPVLVQEWESGRRDRFRKITLGICGTIFVLSLPPVVLVGALSPWIMGLYGTGFRDGWLVLVLLVSAAPFHALAKITSGALLGMNRAWWVLGVNLVWGIALLSLTMWFVPDRGGMGLAIAFTTAYVVLGLLSLNMALYGTTRR